MGSDVIREYRPLRECTSTGSVSYGIVQPGSHVENGVPIIRVNNINDGSLDVTSPLKVDPQIDDKHRKTRLEGGEVLLSLVGTTGQCVVAGPELKGWNVARAIAVIKPAQGISAEWLSICLKSPAAQHYLDNRANTTVQKTLNLKDVREIPIMRVSETEERYILEWWTTLNDKIELNRRMNATLEGMAQALFKSWFVDFDPVIDNALAAGDPIPDELAPRAEVRSQALANGTANREAAKPFPAAFQQTESMGWIPEGWEVKPIENCIQRFPAGKKYASKTAEESGAVPILDQGKSCLIGFHNDEPGVRASPTDPIIVFANHTCYMRLIMFDFSAIQNVLPFKGDGLNIFWLFEATKGRQQFNEYKGHWPDFVIKKLVVPTLPLVSIFGEIVEANHRKIYANELKNQALTKLRDTLLPKLISGELRIPEAEQLIEKTLDV
jgi:type I restriction enzyme S subunit